MNQDSFNESLTQLQERIITSEEFFNIWKHEFKFCSFEINYLFRVGIINRINKIKDYTNHYTIDDFLRHLIPENIYRKKYEALLLDKGFSPYQLKTMSTDIMRTICYRFDIVPNCSGFTLDEFLTL